MKVKETIQGYCIDHMTFGDITNLLMTLKEVSSDVNGECHDNRMELIQKIEKCVYDLANNKSHKYYNIIKEAINLFDDILIDNILNKELEDKTTLEDKIDNFLDKVKAFRK